MISHYARLTPDAEAIVWEDVRISYGELDRLSNRVANALTEMGIGHGDKVALNCPNLPFFPIGYYGILKAGGVVVPICVLFKPDEIEYHLRDSDAKAVFVFEGTPDLPLLCSTKAAFDRVDGGPAAPRAHARPAGWGRRHLPAGQLAAVARCAFLRVEPLAAGGLRFGKDAVPDRLGRRLGVDGRIEHENGRERNEGGRCDLELHDSNCPTTSGPKAARCR